MTVGGLEGHLVDICHCARARRLTAGSGDNIAEIVEDSAQAYLHCRLLGREPRLDF